MRRLFRRIATTIRLFLLVLGLATIALWWRSYHAWDIVTHVEPLSYDSRAYVLLSVRSEKGQLLFDREECLRLTDKGEGSLQKERRHRKRFYYHSSSRDDPYLRNAGGEALLDSPPDQWLVEPFHDGGSHNGAFEIWRYQYTQQRPLVTFEKVTLRLTLIRLPIWIFTLLFLAWPAFALARAQQKRIRRAHRIKNQQCVQCGYDLRATPENCPECGTSAVQRMV